jgi:hypothetical protein
MDIVSAGGFVQRLVLLSVVQSAAVTVRIFFKFFMPAVFKCKEEHFIVWIVSSQKFCFVNEWLLNY